MMRREELSESTMLRKLTFAAAACALAAPALAWGPLGHRTVAGLADRQLSDAARAEVQALLKPDNERTLVDVATWADDLRDTDPGLYRQTSRQHYVNFRDDQCRYDASRDCRGGECVVGALEKYTAILADRSNSRAERADALRFVVHFVGDVHQPLHASFKPDKGGNTVQVRYGRQNWNLHGVWDGLLLNSTHLSWPKYVNRLSGGRDAERGGTPERWAEESCAIVRDGDIYPAGNKIDDAYLERERPVAEQRLRAAGARLAALLNKTLR
ncbi:S1/P1 nuclease [Tahibacter soli]|uniref:S1/P1 nuclease n=1 Tax=Tahibacter soli TaxID=2983605 RepID=A0A9X3YMV8_9GAMM|nr:S1/P1 nuclease [Tahibacter soli]MDC8013658.1 S1/P1 nuclease [Tahibacter soli]